MKKADIEAAVAKAISHPKPGSMVIECLCYELAKVTNSMGVYADETGVNYAIAVGDGSILVRPRTSSARRVVETSRPVTRPITHGDHWTRAFLWATETARLEERQPDVLRSLSLRLKATATLSVEVQDLVQEAVEAFRGLYGREPKLGLLSLGLSDGPVYPGKIGLHEGPKEGLRGSVITMRPEVVCDADYMADVVLHEVIHYVLGHEQKDSHGPQFQAMARALGLPDKYRD